MRGVTRAWAGWLAVVVLLLPLAGGCRPPASEAPASVPAAAEPTPVPARLSLFFPGDDALLHEEPREVPELPVLTVSRIRLVIDELLAGSRLGYAAPLPWAAILGTVFVDPDGNAYLDLSAPPAGVVQGSTAEELLVWSLVNSVIANCPGVGRVQLLLDGREVTTFGHIALDRPLAARPDLIGP